MKKLLGLLLVATLMVSCVYRQATQTIEKTYLGMPISEFREASQGYAKLEVMESGFTVYKMTDYNPMYGHVEDVKFFYFDSSGKLYKIDGGEFKQKRYQIEVINN